MLGQGGHAPPVPVKTSHKKDVRHQQPLIFHVSCPSPHPDNPGSYAEYLYTCKFLQYTEKGLQGGTGGPYTPSDCGRRAWQLIDLMFIARTPSKFLDPLLRRPHVWSEVSSAHVRKFHRDAETCHVTRVPTEDACNQLNIDSLNYLKIRIIHLYPRVDEVTNRGQGWKRGSNEGGNKIVLNVSVGYETHVLKFSLPAVVASYSRKKR